MLGIREEGSQHSKLAIEAVSCRVSRQGNATVTLASWPKICQIEPIAFLRHVSSPKRQTQPLLAPLSFLFSRCTIRIQQFGSHNPSEVLTIRDHAPHRTVYPVAQPGQVVSLSQWSGPARWALLYPLSQPATGQPRPHTIVRIRVASLADRPDALRSHDDQTRSEGSRVWHGTRDSRHTSTGRKNFPSCHSRQICRHDRHHCEWRLIRQHRALCANWRRSVFGTRTTHSP